VSYITAAARRLKKTLAYRPTPSLLHAEIGFHLALKYDFSYAVREKKLIAKIDILAER